MGHGVHDHASPPTIDAALARTVAERMQMLATPSRVQILGQLKQVIYGLHDSHVAELLDQAVFHVQHLSPGAAPPIDGPSEAS